MTPPMERVKQLRDAWERFLGDGRAEAVRDPVAASWRRSLAAGVDPLAHRAAPTLADAAETEERWRTHPLAGARELIRECFEPIVEDSDQLIVVSDEDGMLLSVEGPPALRLEAAESMNFTPGAGWSEAGPGTNAIGTALVADHALQVFAAEHFNEVVQAWVCAAAPVHDPDTGRLLGTIDVTGRLSTAHPDSLGLALATAHGVHAHLRGLMRERDARLRARNEERLAAAGPHALLATPSGRVIAGHDVGAWAGDDRLELPPGGGELILPSGVRAVAEPARNDEAFVVRAIDGHRAGPRKPLLRLRLLSEQARVELDREPLSISRIHTEILALLSDRPDGIPTHELALELYGEDGRPNAVRVQIFRLRKVIGPWIEATPYRLSLHVDSDVAHVRGLLERGAVREAAEHYEGPLLRHSYAPGIVDARDALESWLRQAVMTADDAEALWAWSRSPSGRDDLPAWRRLLVSLDYEDPRRSLAASRVASLRAAEDGDRPADQPPPVLRPVQGARANRTSTRPVAAVILGRSARPRVRRGGEPEKPSGGR